MKESLYTGFLVLCGLAPSTISAGTSHETERVVKVVTSTDGKLNFLWVETCNTYSWNYPSTLPLTECKYLTYCSIINLFPFG